MLATLLALLAVSAAANPASKTAEQTTGPRPNEAMVEDIVAWVNDDVILLTDLEQQEQDAVSQLLGDKNQKLTNEELSRKVTELRNNMLVQMISNKLLVQEAERLTQIDEVKKDVIKRFKERQKIKSDDELDRQLVQWGMTRAELEDRLLEGSAPDIVIDMQVNRNLGVSEQEARAYYESHKAQLTTPAEVVFRELVLVAPDADRRAARRDAAAKLTERARAEDFVALVKQFSEVPSKTSEGKIGPVAIGDLLPAIGQALASAEPGSVVGPIETSQGWHILKLESRKDAVTPTFEQVKANAEAAVRQQKFQPALDEYLKSVWRSATVEVRRPYLDRIPTAWRELVKVKD